MFNLRHRYYPDIPLFLILIPFISAFNYYLTYSDIQLNWFLAFTFCMDTLQGYLAVGGVRACILYLDKVYPYRGRELRRIAIQVPVTTLVGLSIISLLTEALSLIVRGRFAPLVFYTHDLPIISIWFFVVNGIYVILHFYREWKEAETRQAEPAQPPAQGFLVKSGNREVWLPFDDLAGFSVDGNYAVAYGRDGKKYYLDQPLKEIEGLLPSARYFRLNRQFIVSRQFVTGFRRAENGKLVALLREPGPFPPQITISRLRAPDFKRWFRSD